LPGYSRGGWQRNEFAAVSISVTLLSNPNKLSLGETNRRLILIWEGLVAGAMKNPSEHCIMRLLRALRDFFSDLFQGDPIAIAIAVVILLLAALVAVIWIFDLRRRKKEREKKKPPTRPKR